MVTRAADITCTRAGPREAINMYKSQSLLVTDQMSEHLSLPPSINRDRLIGAILILTCFCSHFPSGCGKV